MWLTSQPEHHTTCGVLFKRMEPTLQKGRVDRKDSAQVFKDSIKIEVKSYDDRLRPLGL